MVAPLQEAQFTGPIYLGLAEFALTEHDPIAAAATATAGMERLSRTQDRFYAIELAAVAARAEADAAGLARAHRDEAAAAAAAGRARDPVAFLQEEAAVAEAAFGGRVASMSALAEAESRRAAGKRRSRCLARPRWRPLTGPGSPGRGPTRAFASRKPCSRRGLPAAIGRAAVAEAHAAAERLGATPLRDWVDGLARRARVPIRGDRSTATGRPPKRRGKWSVPHRDRGDSGGRPRRPRADPA